MENNDRNPVEACDLSPIVVHTSLVVEMAPAPLTGSRDNSSPGIVYRVKPENAERTTINKRTPLFAISTSR